MALQATHIRFAIDLKDKYQVKDLEKYVSGAIYPDSRIITGVDRQLTHPEDYKNWDIFNLDDFKKGWHSHLLCDDLQHTAITKRFPDFFPREKILFEDKEWKSLSEIKILQDILDVANFNIVQYLPFLDYAKNPNNEDIKLVIQNSRLVQSFYSQGKVPNLQDYYKHYLELGIDEKVTAQIMHKAQKLLNSEEDMELIKQIYPEILKQSKNLFEK